MGDSQVSFKYTADEVTTLVAYGITDKVTVGVKIPYRWIKNEVHANLDTTMANIGINPIYGQGLDPQLDGVPLIPIGLIPGVRKLTTEDMQQILGNGLDINGDGTIDIPGYGFKPVETWSGNGFLDIEAGAKYQYYKSENWHLAFTGGVRFPTGKVDDPDNLVDYGFGTGAWALLFRAHNDYTGMKNLVFDATLKYDLYIPTRRELRIIENPNQPIVSAANKENVDFKPGDIMELDISGKYQFFKGASFAMGYQYAQAFKTSVNGERGLMYESLEAESEAKSHIYEVALSYSTIPLFMEKKFPFPLRASLLYRNRFAGENNVLKSEYLQFALQILF